VRVLLDENLPHDLAALLIGHHVETVAGRGWSGIHNGELLALASATFEAFLTMDRRLPQQQDIARLPFGVLLIQAPSNRMRDLQPLVSLLLGALPTLRPGTVVAVGA
jgi:predicted nuclease of predicted toxin-antitoxin system